MEHLFTTNIAASNEQAVYQVVFDQELYKFTPEGANGSFPSFALRRNHDGWEDAGAVPAELRKQAVDALEAYLMKQH